MPKSNLTLTIDTDLLVIAKGTNLNLSAEFEEWIKIRMNQFKDEDKKEDPELLIAQHLAEVKRLQSQAELEKDKKDKVSEETASIDYTIDDMVKFNEDLNAPDDTRIRGLIFIFKKRYNKILNPLEVKDMIYNRARERNLIAD